MVVVVCNLQFSSMKMECSLFYHRHSSHFPPINSHFAGLLNVYILTFESWCLAFAFAPLRSYVERSRNRPYVMCMCGFDWRSYSKWHWIHKIQTIPLKCKHFCVQKFKIIRWKIVEYGDTHTHTHSERVSKWIWWQCVYVLCKWARTMSTFRV